MGDTFISIKYAEYSDVENVDKTADPKTNNFSNSNNSELNTEDPLLNKVKSSTCEVYQSAPEVLKPSNKEIQHAQLLNISSDTLEIHTPSFEPVKDFNIINEHVNVELQQVIDSNSNNKVAFERQTNSKFSETKNFVTYSNFSTNSNTHCNYPLSLDNS